VLCDDLRVTWKPDTLTRTWQVGDALPVHNDACMVCGPQGAASLLIEPFRMVDAERVAAQVRFDERHQGAPRYAHGGMVAAVLDDAGGYLSLLIARMFVTAHLEVDYRRPVLLGHTYEVTAACTGIEGRKVHVRAQLRDGEAVIAEATGLFVTVDIDHFRP
jgi:uncharacterized protein (TIGR00369 family)